MSIESKISGFLFLFIFVLQIAMQIFGYILEPTPKHYETDFKLIEIKNNPKRFQISIIIALIEHLCVILLAISLFIAFNTYSIILGLVLIVFRLGEGLIQVYLEKDYWKLRDIGYNYANSTGSEKKSLNDSYRTILQVKTYRFAYAMVCWSIGTLAFSILLIIYEIAPPFIGWIGVVATIPVGFGNGIKIAKKNNPLITNIVSIGGLLAIIFEILIGVGLLFYAFS